MSSHVVRSILSLALLLSLPACQKEMPPLPILRSQGFAPAVKEQLEQAHKKAEMNPADGEAAGRLAMIFHSYRLRDGAMVCYQRARVLDPKNALWPYYMGVIYSTEKNYSQAAAEFRHAAARQPDVGIIQLRLADSLREGGESREECLRVYRALIQSKSNEAHALFGLGRLLEASGLTGEAIDAFSRACAVSPSFGPARLALANLYRRKGDAARAAEQVGLARRSGNREPPLADPFMAQVADLDLGPTGHARRGHQLMARNRWKEAADAFHTALSQDKDSFAAHTGLMSVYTYFAGDDKVREHYAAAIKAEPDSPEALFTWAVFLEARNRLSEAESTLARFLDLDPGSAAGHALFGHVLARQNRPRPAEAAFRTAIAKDPAQIRAQGGLGLILARRGECAEAVEPLSKGAAGKNSEATQAAFELALCFRKLNQPQQARKSLEQARAGAALYGPAELAARIDRELSRQP